MLNGFRREEQSESKETTVYGTVSVPRREPFPRGIIAGSKVWIVPLSFSRICKPPHSAAVFR